MVYRNYTLPHIVKDHGRVEAKLGAVFTLGSPPLPDILVVTDSGKCAIEVKYRGLIVKMGGETGGGSSFAAARTSTRYTRILASPEGVPQSSIPPG